jgi:tryptophan 2,3-dioxygenase
LPEKHGTRFLSNDIVTLWTTVLTRVIRYFIKLSGSFDIMKDGLDPEQFEIFRKSLLPAGGFQTYQFRLIEILLTPYENLIKDSEKENVKNETAFDKKFDHIYWRSGAIEKGTGNRAKVLVNFNNKYDDTFKEVIHKTKDRTVYAEFNKLEDSDKESLIDNMFDLDKGILMWKLSHYYAVTRHLPRDNKGTGGTKWDEYLPVRNQKIYYFPGLWSDKDFNAEVDRMMEELKTLY